MFPSAVENNPSNFKHFEDMSQLKHYLIHYRKKIEKGVDDEKKLYIIRKLRNVRINKDILLETGIGKTVKQLGKEGGKVGDESSALLKLWKECIYKNSVSTSKTFMNGKDSKKEMKQTQPVLSDEQTVDLPYERTPKKLKYDVDYLEHHYISDAYPERTTESVTDSVNKNGHSLYQESQQNDKSLMEEYVPSVNVIPKLQLYDPEKPEMRTFKEYKPTPIPVVKSLSDSNGCSPAEEDEEEVSSQSSHKPSDRDIEEAKREFMKKVEKELLEYAMKKYQGAKSKLSNSNGHQRSNSPKQHKTVHHDKQKVKSPVTETMKKHKSHPKQEVNHQKKHTSEILECADLKEKSKPSNNCTEKETSKNASVIKSTKKKIKVPEAEAFTASEATFEDCLGLNDIVSYKKKKSTKPVKTKQTVVEKTSSPKEISNKAKSSNVVSSDKAKSKLSPDKTKSKSSSIDKVKSKSSTDKVKSKSYTDNMKSKSSSDKVKSKSSLDKVKSKSSTEKSRPKYFESSSKNSRERLEDLPKELRIKPKPIKIEEEEFHITLPEIDANYRPLPRIDYDSSYHSKKVLSNEEAIMFTSSKKDRTAVYSGRKNYFITEVPSLYERCCQVLYDHVEFIEYVGCPYEVLKPILKRCGPESLLRLEDFNPYLLDDTHELWRQHCSRCFKNQTPDEGETWRDMYLRIIDERKKKLEKLTSNIKGSISSSNQVRRAKLAYIDSYVKPPRDVARRQAKYGTANTVNHSAVKTPVPPKVTAKSASPVAVEKSSSSSVPRKPIKPAPLMAKTLKAMKQVYRR